MQREANAAQETISEVHELRAGCQTLNDELMRAKQQLAKQRTKYEQQILELGMQLDAAQAERAKQYEPRLEQYDLHRLSEGAYNKVVAETYALLSVNLPGGRVNEFWAGEGVPLDDKAGIVADLLDSYGRYATFHPAQAVDDDDEGSSAYARVAGDAEIINNFKAYFRAVRRAWVSPNAPEPVEPLGETEGNGELAGGTRGEFHLPVGSRGACRDFTLRSRGDCLHLAVDAARGDFHTAARAGGRYFDSLQSGAGGFYVDRSGGRGAEFVQRPAAHGQR